MFDYLTFLNLLQFNPSSSTFILTPKNIHKFLTLCPNKTESTTTGYLFVICDIHDKTYQIKNL